MWVKTKAEIGLMLPQAKERIGLLEAESGKEVSFPRSSTGSITLPIP